ncbi:hypothetical protein ACFLZZ_03180 [Nanoarchaeota archaeon]
MPLEDLVKYQNMEFANRTAQKEPVLAIQAVREHYKELLGGEEDVAIEGLLERAEYSAQAGMGIGEDLIVKSIQRNHQKYQEAFVKSNVENVLESVRKAGYTNIADFGEYANKSIESFIKEAQSEDASPSVKALAGYLMKLEDHKFEELRVKMQRSYLDNYKEEVEKVKKAEEEEDRQIAL